jgi:calcium-dependent protein kinase
MVEGVHELIHDVDVEEWRGVSEGAKKIVTKLLQLDPKKRITAKEALLEDWCNTVV